MKNVLVSIIIPCYNIEKYVEKCITSISNQTHNNIQIILVDDGSTDNTPEILDRLAVSDERMQVIHTKNAGVSAARNLGLEIACGNYIVFVDGDDYLSPDYVEYMLSLSNICDADFVLSSNCFTKEKESQIEEDSVKSLTSAQATALLLSPRVIVGCWNKMFKSSFIVKHELKFSSSLFYGEGLYFILLLKHHS